MVAEKQNKLEMSGVVRFWLPVLVCMGFIFYASSIPGQNIPLVFLNQDIAFHLIVYLVLGFLYARALKNTYTGMAAAKIILFTVIFGVVYGVTDELHQVFVPYRTVSGLDVLNDGIGSLIGSLTQLFLK